MEHCLRKAYARLRELTPLRVLGFENVDLLTRTLRMAYATLTPPVFSINIVQQQVHVLHKLQTRGYGPRAKCAGRPPAGLKGYLPPGAFFFSRQSLDWCPRPPQLNQARLLSSSIGLEQSRVECSQAQFPQRLGRTMPGAWVLGAVDGRPLER